MAERSYKFWRRKNRDLVNIMHVNSKRRLARSKFYVNSNKGDCPDPANIL